MFEIIVEVTTSTGIEKKGVSDRTQKPYFMAEQKATVYNLQGQVLNVGMIDIFVPKNKDGTFGVPEWKKAGRYKAFVQIEQSRYGALLPKIEYRTMTPILSAAAKAA